MPKKPRPSPPGLVEIRAGTGELFINGRRVQGNQTMLAVLARLFDNLGTVIPYEQLCQLKWLRGVLIANKAPYVSTVARDVGYGLCKMGGDPRLTATSRSAALPELGRNLRRVRTAAGPTQTALAKRSGIHRSYVSALEAGERNPTALTLQRLATVLGVTPTVFFL